jgi:Flp pilus assembly protein TadD
MLNRDSGRRILGVDDGAMPVTGAASDQLVADAHASYAAGDFEAAHRRALAVLAERPDDLAALRVAGRAGFELGLDDAPSHLRAAAELDPDDADTWHDLASALVDAGRLPEAADAFRTFLRLRPGDARALVNLGHATYVSGEAEEAIDYLRQAAESAPGNLAALRGLVHIFRREHRYDAALEVAQQVRELAPDDVRAALDVAECALELERYGEAQAAFASLRALDDDPEHEVYAYHGMIEAAIRRQQWRRALDLAVDATRVDRLGRTTDVLAFVVAQVFGDADRSAPSRAEVEESLASSRREHRRIHEDALVF